VQKGAFTPKNMSTPITSPAPAAESDELATKGQPLFPHSPRPLYKLLTSRLQAFYKVIGLGLQACFSAITRHYKALRTKYFFSRPCRPSGVERTSEAEPVGFAPACQESVEFLHLHCNRAYHSPPPTRIAPLHQHDNQLSIQTFSSLFKEKTIIHLLSQAAFKQNEAFSLTPVPVECAPNVTMQRCNNVTKSRYSALRTWKAPQKTESLCQTMLRHFDG
jgi:hypothetical protein